MTKKSDYADEFVDDDSPPSAAMLKRMAKSKAESRERTVARGLLQFRCDEDLMRRMLAFADKKRVPVGVLCRQWVAERLQEEETSGADTSGADTTVSAREMLIALRECLDELQRIIPRSKTGKTEHVYAAIEVEPKLISELLKAKDSAGQLALGEALAGYVRGLRSSKKRKETPKSKSSP